MVSNFNSEDTPNESINLVGSLDLVVIDPKGNIHIFDYKTSPHPYSKFDP
jgi:ATP-dependent exoDNAse (exonuclease V) beta subunit